MPRQSLKQRQEYLLDYRQYLIKIVFLLPFIALCMWIATLVNFDPTCSIQDFYLPALINKTANFSTISNVNTTIYFRLNLKNEEEYKGILYDALNLTFYYGPNRTHPIGNTTFPKFHQGHEKNTDRRELLQTYDVPWEAVLRAVSNGTAVFRVDLAMAMRFRFLSWNSKRHKLVVGSTVEVNDSGNKVKKKAIILKSGATKPDCYLARRTLLVVFILMLFI